jgi:hypothetical protein
MVNTVTTVGLGFFGYDFGVEYYKRHIMDKPRNPSPGALRHAMLLDAAVVCWSPAASLMPSTALPPP